MAKILVVNDESDLVDLIELALQSVGHEVQTTIDGTDAVELVERMRPDLVLLDWVLGGTTGGDVIREIRGDPGVARTPIILFSALSDARQKATEVGADGFLAKPFTIEELLFAVDSVIDPLTRFPQVSR